MIDDPSDPDLEHLIRELIRDGLARVRTVGPGVVVDYDASKQRATVRATVYGRRWDEESRALVVTEGHPVANVPILFARGATWSITGPLVEGDPVVLFACERSIADWKATGRAGAPEDYARRFDASDWIAMPTGSNFVDVLPAEAVDGSDVVIRLDNGIRIGGASAVQFAARDDRVAARISRLEDFAANHTHDPGLFVAPSGGGPVSGTSGGATSDAAITPRTTAADVASDKVRIL